MRGVNKVILVGKLSKDPEVRQVNSTSVASVSLVTSEYWKDKNSGEQKEKSEFHNVKLWGKLAEIAGQYLSKGSQIYVEGQLQTRKWQDKNGVDRYSTEVVVQGFNGSMQMLGGGNQSNKPKINHQEAKQPVNNQQGYQPRPTVTDDFSDEIPF